MSAPGDALRVLVVDDERLSRQTSLRQLRDHGYHAAAVDNGFAALQEMEGTRWDVVLTDLRMPGMDGLDLLKQVQELQPGTDVILMTAYGTVEAAVDAMRAGAFDFLTKPFHFEELAHRLRRLIELRSYRREVEELRALVKRQDDSNEIVGRCPAMRLVADKIRSFAPHGAPVLVTGETGTGKELVARALHRESPRSAGPFVPVACGAIPTELAESELFGHERGAFTGAVAQRQGTLERAHGGTLLLDDVDDLPLLIQAKLLRALQEGTFTRVGGQREITVDVRLIATTKIDLGEAARGGHFRDDLYYRLRGLEIELPPLRERQDDILLLTHLFLRRYAGAGAEPPLTPEAARCLLRHAWPGNVRELERAIEAAVTLSGGGPIEPRHLPREAGCGEEATRLFSLHLEGREGIPFADAVRELEDELVAWAMEQAGGQQKRAAELLGLPRTTFQSKLSRNGGGQY